LYLQGQLYELNLGTFNSVFGFPPNMDLLNRQVPYEFNPIWGELSGLLGTTLVHPSTHILGTLACASLNVS